MNATDESAAELRGGSRRVRDGVILPIVSLVIVGGATAGCYFATGPTLGLFMGTLAIVAIVGPALLTAQVELKWRAMSALAIFLGAISVCFYAVAKSPITVGQFCEVGAVMLAWVIAIFGLVSMLLAVRVHAAVVSLVVVFFLLMWLSWPLWMSPYLSGHESETLVERLIDPNPVFAVNKVLTPTSDWLRKTIIYHYHMSALPESVNYALPNSVWSSVIWHGMVGMLMSAGAWVVGKRVPTPGEPGRPRRV